MGWCRRCGLGSGIGFGKRFGSRSGTGTGRCPRVCSSIGRGHIACHGMGTGDSRIKCGTTKGQHTPICHPEH